MSLIATVTLITRLPKGFEADTEHEAKAIISDGISEIMQAELMRYNKDKHLLADWTGTGKTKTVATKGDQHHQWEFHVPVELCLNMECPENRTQAIHAATGALDKLFDDKLQPATDTVLASWITHDARPGVTVTDQYEETDAWAYPEYKACFLEAYPVFPADKEEPLDVRLESFIESSFIANQLTAQKAARIFVNRTEKSVYAILESREDFERRAAEQGLPLDYLDDEDRYESMETERFWQGWSEAIDWMTMKTGATNTIR